MTSLCMYTIHCINKYSFIAELGTGYIDKRKSGTHAHHEIAGIARTCGVTNIAECSSKIAVTVVGVSSKG